MFIANMENNNRPFYERMFSNAIPVPGSERMHQSRVADLHVYYRITCDVSRFYCTLALAGVVQA